MNDSKEFKPTKKMFLNEWLTAIGLLLMAIIAPIALSKLESISNTPIESNTVVLLWLSIGCIYSCCFTRFFVAWTLKEIFRDKQKILSNITMIIRWIYGVLLLLSLFPLIHISNEITSDNMIKAFNSFDSNWNAALCIFGLHLIFLGIVIIRSGFLSWILGVLVVIAGFGYMFDFIITLIIPNTTLTISGFTFIGEALLIIWLPINAIRLKKQNN